MFKLNFIELRNAFRKVKIVAEMNKSSVKAFLLEQKEDLLRVKYSDGKRSLITTMGIVESDGNEQDFKDQLVIPLQHLENFLKMLETSSSDMSVSDVEITVYEDKKIIEMKATKLLRLAGDEEEEFKTISKFERQIPYEMPNANLKYGVLTRFNYDELLEEPAAEIVDSYEKPFLIKMLSILDDEKASSVISSKKKNIDGSVGAGFVVGSMHSTIVKNDSCENAGFTLNKVNYPMMKIVEAFDGDTVHVNRSGEQFVNMVNEERTEAIQFQLAQAVKAEMMTMELMTGINFGINIAFVYVAMKDIIASLANQHPDDNLLMSFGESEEDGLVAVIATSKDSKSSKDRIELKIENVGLLTDAVIQELKGLELKIALKAVISALNKIGTDYVAFSYMRDETKNNLNILRIAEILGITEEKEIQGGLDIGTSCFITYATK